MSGLTRHRNAMHPPLNTHIQPSPPLDDVDFNFGGLGTNTYDDNGCDSGMSPTHNGQNNLGPHEATQGDAQTLRHPILNGKLFLHAFLFYFLTESSVGMPCDSLGNYLPSSTPPPPYTLPREDGVARNDWHPFHNCAQFEIADFLYT